MSARGWRRLIQLRLRTLLVIMFIAAFSTAAYLHMHQRPVTLILDGYCPVRLVHQSQWIKGDARYTRMSGGRIYRFANAESLVAFEANPDKYVPMCNGYDVVRLRDEHVWAEGKREHGLFFDGQIVLFENETTLAAFNSNADVYATFAESLDD